MAIHHFKAKRKRDTLLFKIMVTVAALHIAGMLLLGTLIITETIIIGESEFQAPPPPEKVEKNQQRAQERRIQSNQNRSTKTTKRITVTTVKNQAMSEIAVTLPPGTLTTNIINMPTPTGIGNIDVLSSVDLFGVVSKSEKVLIVIDASANLMNEERGGLATYQVIRSDVKNLVNSLPSTMLFNLMAYSLTGGYAIDLYRESLIAATESNKKGVSAWIDPINSSLDKIGVRNTYKLRFPFLPQPPHSQHYSAHKANCYRIYQAALEQGADTIYFLVTEWTDPDEIKQPWTEAQTESYRKRVEDFEARLIRERAKKGWTEEKEAEYQTKISIARAAGIAKARKWIEEENKRRKAAGQSLYVGTPDQAMHEQKFYAPPQDGPPHIDLKPVVPPTLKSYGLRGIINFYKDNLTKDIYTSRGRTLPVVNMIVFKGKKEEIKPEESRVFKNWTQAHRGSYRILRGITPVE